MATLLTVAIFPGMAQAHGAVDPVATSFLARLSAVPAGLDAKVVDGDLRLWLSVSPSVPAVVLDYRGAPYLRFSRSGVAVNVNSVMYYLNLTPVQAAPSRVSPAVAPRWQQASSGHQYSWHDGRLQGLASVALAPGTRYVGRWNIPVTIDGQMRSIVGGLFYAPAPSIVWFWPILVLLACALAAWRVRRSALDDRVVGSLAAAALIGIAVAGVGRELHGRPTISVSQAVTFAVVLGFVAWGVRRVLARRLGYFSAFMISVAAIWEGVQLVPTLLNGFVLAAVPAFMARTAAVVCLGCGIGLLVFVFRLADQREPEELGDEYDFEDTNAWGSGIP